MDLFEYQAKALFAEFDVPVPPGGRVAGTPEEAEAIATDIGGVVVVKAQVKTGGRGKAGGVKLAQDAAAARAAAQAILGMDIKGHTVRAVLVEPASQIAEEYYASFLLDRANRTFLAMCSHAGGMDIEEVAATQPEALAKIPVDPLAGVDPQTAAAIVAEGGLPEEVRSQAAAVLVQLWRVFAESDATLVEVNPLIRTADDRIVALDGKVTLDGNAEFRHDWDTYHDVEATDPLEVRAKQKNLNYVKLYGGQVGIIGNGAGLVMSALDVVAYAGEDYGGIRPANFLDIGGGASAEVMANGLDIVLSDPDVRSVFVNVFGGITACDAVADGIVSAIRMVEQDGSLDKQLVVRLDGNNAPEGHRILDEFDHPRITRVDSMDDAARRAAQLAAAGA